jgi:hypothetical protein
MKCAKSSPATARSACRPTFNGQEFGASFHWHLLDKGIGHVYIRPRTPRLNVKVERSHRIDAEEFYRLHRGFTEGLARQRTANR